MSACVALLHDDMKGHCMVRRMVCCSALVVLLAGCIARVPVPPPLPEAQTFGARAVAGLQQRDAAFECKPEKLRLWLVDLGSLRIVTACDGPARRGIETTANRLMGALVTANWTVALLQHELRDPQRPDTRTVVYSTVVHDRGSDVRCQLAGANALHVALLPLGQRADLPARREALLKVLSAPGFRLAPAGAVCEHASFMATPPASLR